MSARSLAYLIALLGLGLDQASKLWALYLFDIEAVITRQGPVAVTPFFDLVLVWNKGISYGWFQQHDDMGRLALIGVAALASVGLAIWMWQARGTLVLLGLGLVLGGALGNGIDRIVHGAVVDLFHFYWQNFSWYVFNLADVWIVIGAALLIYDSFFGSHDKHPETGRNDAANE